MNMLQIAQNDSPVITGGIRQSFKASGKGSAPENHMSQNASFESVLDNAFGAPFDGNDKTTRPDNMPTTATDSVMDTKTTSPSVHADKNIAISSCSENDSLPALSPEQALAETFSALAAGDFREAEDIAATLPPDGLTITAAIEKIGSPFAKSDAAAPVITDQARPEGATTQARPTLETTSANINESFAHLKTNSDIFFPGAGKPANAALSKTGLHEDSTAIEKIGASLPKSNAVQPVITDQARPEGATTQATQKPETIPVNLTERIHDKVEREQIIRQHDAASTAPVESFAAVKAKAQGLPRNDMPDMDAAQNPLTQTTLLETVNAKADKGTLRNETNINRQIPAKTANGFGDLQQQGVNSIAADRTSFQERRIPEAVTGKNAPSLSPGEKAPASHAKQPSYTFAGDREAADRSFVPVAPDPKSAASYKTDLMPEAMSSANGGRVETETHRLSGLPHTTNQTQDVIPLRPGQLNHAAPAEIRTQAIDRPSAPQTQAVIEQIIAARQSINGDFGRIRILLNPPNLGSVDLEIFVRKERVEVLMTADNTRVQQILQSRADDIRTALQRHDLKIEGFQVVLQDHTAGQNQTGGGAFFDRRQEHTKQGLAKGDSAESAIPAASVIPAAPKSASIKGRLSIFA